MTVEDLVPKGLVDEVFTNLHKELTKVYKANDWHGGYYDLRNAVDKHQVAVMEQLIKPLVLECINENEKM